MKIEESLLDGVLFIKPNVFEDSRGFFLESFNQKNFELATGLNNVSFLQDNHSQSTRGVLRGLHFQTKFEQAKLVRVTKGEIFDVVVDIRKKSKTFGDSFGINLSQSNHLQLWIPKGFAHGFQVISELAEVQYKTTDYWSSEHEKVLLWNDPELRIDWPLENPILSEKDMKGKLLSELMEHT